MTAPRRVVTDTDADGRSYVASDGPAPRSHAYSAAPGMRSTIVWGTTAAARPGAQDRTPELDRDLPALGETRLVVVTFPPDSVFAAPGFDPAAADADTRIATPMLAECFEPDDPGMHRSPAIDYAVVVAGEIHLELDDGTLTRLGVGDLVIQNATRHAWRNRADVPATVVFTWIGTPESP